MDKILSDNECGEDAELMAIVDIKINQANLKIEANQARHLSMGFM